MKRILFLFVVFFISSSFESGVKPPLRPESEPSHPVIVDPNPRPAASTGFENPDDPNDSFTASVSVSQNGFTISLGSRRYIDYVLFTNLNTGYTNCEWVYRSTNLINSLFNMSNGHWQIDIVSYGTHYQADFMVNDPAYGPIGTCDLIDGEYYDGHPGWSGGF